MSGAALLLVVAAAFAHAVWNLFAKRAGSAGVVFIWLYTAVALVLYAPAAWWQLAVTDVSLGVTEAGFILGSTVLHLAYFSLLQRGYAIGDLSIVYPVARGLGPVLAVVGAVVLFGEGPSLQALVGAMLVCAAIAGLGIAGWAASSLARTAGPTLVGVALTYAALTGMAIACYTLWDAHAVGSLGVPPLVFTWTSELGRCMLLAPVILRRRAALRDVWREHRTPVVAVGTLSPLAYILVLTAFTIAPVSYVAPVRELSIVIGTALGAKLLGEGQGRIRVVAAAIVVIGVALVVTG